MQPIVLMDSNNKLGSTLDSYSFKGVNGLCVWPKLQGQGLGSCGMWNMLWRVGFHPAQLTVDKLPHAQNKGVLFVDKSVAMDSITLAALRVWMQQGGKIVATGGLTCWEPFLPSDTHWKTSSFDNPYAGVAYIDDDLPQLIAPPNWSFIESIEPIEQANYMGRIVAVQGERQTPGRAILVRHDNAPAIIKHHLFYYFNGHPFSALQAWLQGQEDLSPWLAWRHRLFWLDEYISFLCDLLFKNNILNPMTERPGITHLKQTSVVLRHDLDYSRDTSFLEEENAHQIPATYAVLKDRNTKFWVNTLRKSNRHEIAFHYNTGKRNWLGLLKRYLLQQSHPSFVANKRIITRKGLLKQLLWAKKQGVDVQTIHRHLAYLIYPECIDALDAVFDSDLEVVGSSSFFRGQVLKWGMDRVDGQHGYMTDWPDVQFPLWYPYKLAHAGKNGKMLKGWELSCMMDIEPSLLLQLLEHKIKYINQNVFTLIYHPAHAQGSSLYRHGSFEYFKKGLEMLDMRKINILTMKDLLQPINTGIA